MEFVEHMQEIESPHRIAAGVGRQVALVGALLCVVLAARSAGSPFPEAIGLGFAALVVIILLEALAGAALSLWAPRQALRTTAFAVRAAHLSLIFAVLPIRAILLWVRARERITDEEREEEQEEEVEALIEVGEREGLLEADEGAMVRGIVELDERTVREIMTPRTDIVALPETASVEEARRTIQEAGHSRLPVFRESIDNVIGVLHARDLFHAWQEKGEQESIARYLRNPSFVPESRSAADLLGDMRQTSHLALVVDEYGGIAGLVTLEDLLEEIVGEITDEYEEEEQPVRAEKDGSYVISAGTHVDELEDLFDLDLGEREYDTVGGFVVFGFGRVPAAGESIEVHGLRIVVTEAERRRVHQVRVRRVDEADRAETG